MKRYAALLCALCLSLSLCWLLPVHGEAEIYEDVIRLHVLANSDTEEDQAHKLIVRDAVLAETHALLAETDTLEEACRTLSASLPRLEEVAAQTLRDLGDSCPVTVCLTEEQYPTRRYGDTIYPAGTYTSLQVRIGEAAGQNWWCVLYPSLCLSQSTGNAPTLAGTQTKPKLLGLTERQYTVITGQDANVCEVRLKLLETLESFLNH